MLWDLINKDKLRRALLYALYMTLVLLVQDALFSRIAPFGVRTMFVPAAVVAVGLFEGGIWGAVFGLALGFLADISFNNTALFIALFPCIGFFSGALARWLVNKRFFAYMCVCLAAFAVTALFQMLRLLLRGQDLGIMLWTALLQTLLSLPLAAPLYFPCRAISRKKL